MDYDYLSASNGSGDAAIMHVQADRLVGSTTIDVDSVSNVPAKFFATSGTLLASGFIDSSTECNFRAHLSGTTVIIDSYLPGSTDKGTTQGQVVVIKPTTAWANRVATFIANATGHGTPDTATFGATTVGALTTGNVTTTGNIAVSGTVRSSPRVSATTSTATLTPNIDTTSIYDLTAQAAALTVANPAGTPRNGDVLIIRLKDNGTSQSISWGTAYSNISGLSNLTATAAGKWHTIGATYNSAVTSWQIVSITTGA